MEQFEQIEKYLSNELSEAELKKFESAMEHDERLFNEVEAHRLARKALQLSSESQLEMDLMEAGRKKLADLKPPARSGKNDFNWVNVLRYAAMIVLAIGVGISINQFRKNDLSELAIFEKYYTSPDVAWLAVRGGPEDSVRTWNTALQHYQARDYDQAVKLFQQSLETSGFPYPSAARYLLGICFLAKDDVSAAIQNLMLVPMESSVYEESHWYLGLGYLRNKQPELAESIFQKIASDGKHTKTKEAQEILDMLSNK